MSGLAALCAEAAPRLARIEIAAGFDFSGPEYRALFRRAVAGAFQHPDWLAPFYRCLVERPDAEPLVVTGRDAAGRLVLVVPLIRTRTDQALRIDYAFLGVTDYARPVIAPEVDLDREGPGLSARFLDALGPHDQLCIEPVRQDHAASWQALIDVAPETLAFGAHELACDAASADWRLRRFGRRKVAEIDRKAHRLAALGPVRLEVLAGAGIAAAMAVAQGFRHGRFAGDPLQEDRFLAFYAEVAQRGAESGLARTYRLTCGDATVAILFGLIEDRRFCYLVLGCDYAAFGKVSPGTLMFDRAMAHWFQSGGAIFDFTVGDEAFKTAFGCVRTPMLRFRRGGT